jgi:NADH:ubiquinone oxidoreductase subunit H
MEQECGNNDNERPPSHTTIVTNTRNGMNEFATRRILSSPSIFFGIFFTSDYLQIHIGKSPSSSLLVKGWLHASKPPKAAMWMKRPKQWFTIIWVLGMFILMHIFGYQLSVY